MTHHKPQETLFPLTGVPSRWPDIQGRVAATPHRHRYDERELQAVNDFYRDILWSVQLGLWGLDLHGFPAQGRAAHVPPLAAMQHVAAEWGLPAANQSLPRAPAGQHRDTLHQKQNDHSA